VQLPSAVIRFSMQDQVLRPPMAVESARILNDEGTTIRENLYSVFCCLNLRYSAGGYEIVVVGHAPPLVTHPATRVRVAVTRPPAVVK